MASDIGRRTAGQRFAELVVDNRAVLLVIGTGLLAALAPAAGQVTWLVVLVMAACVVVTGRAGSRGSSGGGRSDDDGPDGGGGGGGGGNGGLPRRTGPIPSGPAGTKP